MKILTTLFCTLILTLQLSAQIDNRVESAYKNILSEKPISKSFPFEQVKHPSLSTIINDKESRTIVNKTMREDGFLLIEEMSQIWTGTNWRNDRKNTYFYNMDENISEKLYQRFNGETWENTFDKIWHLRFTPNNQLTALVSELGEWTVAVDDTLWENRFGYIWNPIIGRQKWVGST